MSSGFRIPTLLAAILFLLGCKTDAVRQDPTLTAHTAPEQPATQAPLSAASRAPVTQVSQATDEPLIVCFGDSITAGYGIDPESSYPADLQHDLDAAGFHYRVLNMGISGETTKDGLVRVPHVLAHKPDLVVVEFGGNDGLRGLPIPDAQRNLAAIVTALRRGGARVLLAGITLPPQYGADYVTQFNGMYPAVARQTSVPLLPFLYKNVYDVPGDIQEDGIHPTIEGARQVALNIEELVKPMLHK